MAKQLQMDFITTLSDHGGYSFYSTRDFLVRLSTLIFQAATETGTARVKHIGTFKLVEVPERESIDVNTGQRITIAGYKKLSFTPDQELIDRLNAQAEGAIDASEDNAETPDTVAIAETSIEVEPEGAEMAMAETETATDANVNSTEEPETTPETPAEEETVAEKEIATEPEITAEPEPQSPTLPPVTPEHSEPKTSGKKSRLITYIAIGIILLIALIAIIANLGSASPQASQQQTEENAQVEQRERASETVSDDLKTTDAAETTSPKDQTAAPTPAPAGKSSSKQKTHTLQYGETLTTISQLYYGTPDSMAAIWHLNNFSDPNNIPIGTEIQLP